MAVPIFMILSGYVMSNSYEHKNYSSFEQVYSIGNVLRSAIRFTVPFIFAHTIVTVGKLVRALTAGQGIISAIKYFVIGFLNGGSGQGVYYYPIMIQFIFVFPVIYFVMKSKKGTKGIIICFVINLIYEVLKTAYGMNAECYRLLIFRYIFAIAAGAYMRIYGFPKIKTSIISLAIGLIYIWVIKYTPYESVFLTYWQGTSLLSIFYIAPIIGCLIKHFSASDMQKMKLLRFMGKASYNIFLTQMVYYLFDTIIAKYIAYDLVHVLFNVVVCVAVGLLFYKIEQPITKKLILFTSRKLNGGGVMNAANLDA